MNRSVLHALVAFAIVTASAPGATLWTATLSPSQEVPPNASPASGTGTASYDPTTTILSVNLSWIDLTTAPVAGHIHCCVAPGANAPVAIPFPGLPTAVTGTYSNTFNLSLASTFNPQFLTARGNNVTAARTDLLSGLDGGLAYFNLHTTTFPNGEIRGNITASDVIAIPEPRTAALLLVGLSIVLCSARRRQA